MADDDIDSGSAEEFSATLGRIEAQTVNLAAGANGLAAAMTRAFVQSTAGGRQLDDVLKGLALRVSGLALSQALRPLTAGLAGGLNGLFGGLFGLAPNVAAATGAVKPFAAGGVIGTPTYFPLAQGGLGLAGEAGPEAILPLRRGADGRLGVASGGGAPPAQSVVVNIQTPDAESFRRSEVYVTGQIARAVARGQRSL